MEEVLDIFQNNLITIMPSWARKNYDDFQKRNNQMINKYKLELENIYQKRSHIEDIKKSNLSKIIKNEILDLYKPILQRKNLCKTMIIKYKERIIKNQKLKENMIYGGIQCCQGNEWYERRYQYTYLKESSQ